MTRYTKLKPGCRFGALTVMKLALIAKRKGKKHHAVWYCQCDCGNVTMKRADYLLQGKSRSCGIVHRFRSNSGSIKPLPK